MSTNLNILHLSDTHLNGRDSDPFLHLYPNENFLRVLIHAYYRAFQRIKANLGTEALLTLFQHSTLNHCSFVSGQQLLDLDYQQFYELKEELPPFPQAYDYIFNNGDIINDKQDPVFAPQAYTKYYQTIERYFPDTPHLVTPGNHDPSELYEGSEPLLAWEEDARLPSLRETGKIKVYTLANNQKVINFSSLYPEHVGGRCTEEQAQVLRELLANPAFDKAILYLHHNPYDTDNAWLNSHQYPGFTSLRTLLQQREASGNKLYIFHGHIHQAPPEKEPQGTDIVQIYSCPATSIQFKPFNQDFALDYIEAGYRLYQLSPDKEILNMEVVRVPNTKGDYSQIKKFLSS